MNELIEALAREWVKLFRLRPVMTAVSTGVVVALVSFTITYLNALDRTKREAKRLEGQDYQRQLDQLNQTEANIQQLLQFVGAQKKTLRETEDTISALKSEKEKLQPLVESDRAVVEALFRVQEERTSVSVWRERWIGFGFGILASLIASFLWFIASFLIEGHRADKLIQRAANASAD